MNKRRIWITALVSVLVATSTVVVSGAPGASRMPWGDNQELLRLQVMGPGVEAPTKEYIIYASEAIEEAQILQLGSLGIDVISVRGQSAVVRGALTAFSELSGEGLSWAKSVLPNLPVEHFGDPKFYAVEMEHVLSACEVEQLQSVEAGDGALIGVIDTGFTGYLEDLLGADRVSYVEVAGMSDSGVGSAEFVSGRNEDDGDHGTLCAEAIAAIVPNAEFVLFSAPMFFDRLNTLELIAEGAKITMNGRSIKLSDLDVISDSTGAPLPLDHNDGQGEFAQLADRIVASGIPYVHALGNSGEGEATDESFYASGFTDDDGNLLHDFDPGASSVGDANSLSLQLDPWDGDGSAYVRVILEWDGWPYQLRSSSSRAWTTEEIARIQDVDLFVYYQESDASSVSLVSQSDWNQFGSLYGSGPLYPVEPLEIVEFLADEPGTYLLVVKNVTSLHPNNLPTRSVDFHMYVSSVGTAFSLEHHTPEGAFVNVGGAKDVLGVGAVGFATTESWCLMPFSSRGPTSDGRLKPEIVAPNVYLSDFVGGPFPGTSAAAPVVTGIVALLRNAVPSATPQMVREALCRTAQQLPEACNDVAGPASCTSCGAGCNYGVGCGMVNAWEAYLYLKNAAN